VIGNYGQEQGMQNTASSAVIREECLTQTPQLELVGHSIVSLCLSFTVFFLPQLLSSC